VSGFSSPEVEKSTNAFDSTSAVPATSAAGVSRATPNRSRATAVIEKIMESAREV
jgi:hypothetical protein